MLLSATHKIMSIVIKIKVLFATLLETKLIVWLIIQIVIYAILKMDYNALIMLLDGIQL
jgi:hypothetical protein